MSEGVLEAAATTVHPDGVVATALLPQVPWPQQPQFLLALDHLQDPGNLGTLLRTALAAQVGGVVLAQCADPWQPKVLRAAAGASFALPIRQVPNLEPVLVEAHQQGLRTMATCVCRGAALHPIGLVVAQPSGAGQRGRRALCCGAELLPGGGLHPPQRCRGLPECGGGWGAAVV